MGGRGAKMSRRTNPYSGRPVTAGAGGGTANMNEETVQRILAGGDAGRKDFPNIENFSQKNIVSFTFGNNGRGGTITIRDDNGRIFEGTFEGAGASRSTYSFKEGFVMKFDKLSGHGLGNQNRQEVEAYKELPPSIRRRVPEMVKAYNGVTVRNDSGLSRNVDVLIMTKAKGGHDTGVKANSKQGRRLMKRLGQYQRALENRGVHDVIAFERNGNVYVHNVYYNRGSGKRLTLVDVGIGNKALMKKVKTQEEKRAASRKSKRR